MLGLTLVDKFKRLDVYRKLPKDIAQPTYSGAMLSIISTTIMVFLFMNEFYSYTKIKTASEMYIDVNRGGDMLTINVDIDLVRLPCSILSLDVQDVMGSHIMNIGGNLKKFNLGKDGKSTGEFKELPVEQSTDFEHNHEHDNGNNNDNTPQPDYHAAKQQFMNGEGCKVPGNFHISSHAFGPTIQMLASEGLFIDVSHKVNHLSFGDDKDLKVIKKVFKTGELNPLDKTAKIDNAKKVYEYYMKIVPTTYVDMYDKSYYVNQFTSHSNEVPAYMQLPTIFFRYDMSPVTVKYYQYKENFLHFVIQICAILGGIFSVTGIIDALIHKSVLAILRKANMGKLT